MQRKKSFLYYWWIRIFHITLSLAILASLLIVDTELKRNLFDVNGHGIFVALAYLVLFALALAMYICACTTDPGYVDLIDIDDKDEESDVDSNQNTCSENSSMIAGVQLRHCGFCDVKQPLRSRHCEDCGRCVRKYDHHCPWLNACIGELNHKYFLIFLTLECCLIVWTAVIVLHSVKHEAEWSAWFMANAAFLVVGFVLVAGGLPAIFLCAFHAYLMCSGQTTWEVVSRERISYLKNRAWDFYPFDEGCLRNSSRFLCQCTAHKWEVVYSKMAASDKSSAA